MISFDMIQYDLPLFDIICELFDIMRSKNRPDRFIEVPF